MTSAQQSHEDSGAILDEDWRSQDSCWVPWTPFTTHARLDPARLSRIQTRTHRRSRTRHDTICEHYSTPLRIEQRVEVLCGSEDVIVVECDVVLSSNALQQAVQLVQDGNEVALIIDDSAEQEDAESHTRRSGTADQEGGPSPSHSLPQPRSHSPYRSHRDSRQGCIKSVTRIYIPSHVLIRHLIIDTDEAPITMSFARRNTRDTESSTTTTGMNCNSRSKRTETTTTTTTTNLRSAIEPTTCTTRFATPNTTLTTTDAFEFDTLELRTRTGNITFNDTGSGSGSGRLNVRKICLIAIEAAGSFVVHASSSNLQYDSRGHEYVQKYDYGYLAALKVSVNGTGDVLVQEGARLMCRDVLVNIGAGCLRIEQGSIASRTVQARVKTGSVNVHVPSKDAESIVLSVDVGSITLNFGLGMSGDAIDQVHQNNHAQKQTSDWSEDEFTDSDAESTSEHVGEDELGRPKTVDNICNGSRVDLSVSTGNISASLSTGQHTQFRATAKLGSIHISAPRSYSSTLCMSVAMGSLVVPLEVQVTRQQKTLMGMNIDGFLIEQPSLLNVAASTKTGSLSYVCS